MGYRIDYDRGNGKFEISEVHPWRFLLMLAGTLSLFFFLAVHFWPDGAEVIRSFLIPGEDAVTVQAFQTMTDDLRSGASVSDAVEGFCRFVIHGR